MRLLWLLALYPAALVGFFLTVFIIGLAGKEELILPPVLRTVLRILTAPLYGFHCVDATTVGYCTVFYAAWMADDANMLRAHESFHRYQSLRCCPGGRLSWVDGHLVIAILPNVPERILGAIWYGVLYVREYFRSGYRENLYEREARIAAGQE